MLACRQATYTAGSGVVNAFAAVDEWLESRHWFTALVPQPFPAEVMDETTGSMKGECKEVRRKHHSLRHFLQMVDDSWL